MTTYTINLEEDEEDSAEAFLRDLDNFLRKDSKKGIVKKAKIPDSPPIIHPIWHPSAVVLMVEEQRCSNCGAVSKNVQGRFLESITRNGATRFSALGAKEAIPGDFANLPRTTNTTLTPIPACPECWGKEENHVP